MTTNAVTYFIAHDVKLKAGGTCQEWLTDPIATEDEARAALAALSGAYPNAKLFMNVSLL